MGDELPSNLPSYLLSETFDTTKTTRSCQIMLLGTIQGVKVASDDCTGLAVPGKCGRGFVRKTVLSRLMHRRYLAFSTRLRKYSGYFPANKNADTHTIT